MIQIPSSRSPPDGSRTPGTEPQSRLLRASAFPPWEVSASPPGDAGGLILLLIGLDMLEAKRSPTQEASGDKEEAANKEDAGIVPLGIPMLAGPGAISSVMVLVGQVPHFWGWEMGAILGSIAVTALVSYWVLAAASRVRAVLGETGIRILVRIMGLLLVALAMQFFVNGLTDLGVISKQ